MDCGFLDGMVAYILRKSTSNNNNNCAWCVNWAHIDCTNHNWVVSIDMRNMLALKNVVSWFSFQNTWCWKLNVGLKPLWLRIGNGESLDKNGKITNMHIKFLVGYYRKTIQFKLCCAFRRAHVIIDFMHHLIIHKTSMFSSYILRKLQ